MIASFSVGVEDAFDELHLDKGHGSSWLVRLVGVVRPGVSRRRRWGGVPRNSAIARATGSGRWMCRRWPTPSIVHSSTCGSDERRKSATSTHSGWVSAAEHGQHGAVDGGGLLGAERPLGEGGQLDAEERVGVLDRLRDRARQPLVEQRLGRSAQSSAAHDAHEDGEGAFVVAAAVGLERRPGLLEEGLAAGHREQRQLEQDQRVHASRDGRGPAGRRPPRRWSGRRRGRAARRGGRGARRRRRRGPRRSPAPAVWVLPTQPRLW